MPDFPSTVGAILAGGSARRLGGGDKTMRRVGERTILARLLYRLRPQVSALVLNANDDPARFAPYGLPVIADSISGQPGPLAGVVAGLDWAAATGSAAWVVTVPGDAPFLPTDLISRLHEGRSRSGALLASAASGGRTHPVITLWPVSLHQDLRRALTLEGIRKIDRFTGRYPLAIVEWPVEEVDPFFNLNTPEDLAEAERLVAAAPEQR
jgi:molybdopterin-guanine dinucleotide biosynthesis protein A